MTMESNLRKVSRVLSGALSFFIILLSVPAFAQSEAFQVKGSTGSTLFYVGNDSDIAIDTSITLGTLTIAGNNGLISLGTNGSGTALSLGAGTRMMWYPLKSAFRAGYVSGTQWDDANIGDYSIAMGWSPTASGTSSFALGDDVTASGYDAMAVGRKTVSSGYGSFAAGYHTVSGGFGSFAAGLDANADSSGTFVWSDGSGGTFTNTKTNQFLIHASNGVGIGTNGPATALQVHGVVYSDSGGFEFPNGSIQTTAAAASQWTSNGPNIYYNGGSVGINTNSTSDASLTVGGDGGILSTGTVGSGTALSLGAGTRMMWYPYRAAFRAGYVNGTQWDDDSIGDYSTAFGCNTIASGEYSVAFGNNSQALGVGSTAIGGGYATADSSTCIGPSAGTGTTAVGSLVLTDGSGPITVMVKRDAMWAIYSGGYYFNTNSSGTSGAVLAANSNSWSTISDSTKKYAFLPVNDDSVLDKINTFDLRTWSYKGQDSTKYRHYGPMAQEFFNAFGHDKYGVIGNDTTINQADFEGVLLVAVQGLLRKEIHQNKEMRSEKQEIGSQMAEIEAQKEAGMELSAEVAGLIRQLRSQEEATAALQAKVTQLREAVAGAGRPKQRINDATYRESGGAPK